MKIVPKKYFKMCLVSFSAFLSFLCFSLFLSSFAFAQGETTDTAADVVSSGDDRDPINTYTGELFDNYSPDLNLGGPMPLFFSRYYASGLKNLGVTGNMGDNWRHNFEWTMTLYGIDATITSTKGRSIYFSKYGTSWDLTGKTDVPFQLAASGSDYVLYEPGTEHLYTFDSSGKLTKIEDGKGSTHTLRYSGITLALVQVSDGLGRALTFTYDGNSKLSTISDCTRTVILGYTNNDLTSVTDARGEVTNYAYATGGLLTSKTRPAGNTPYTQTYDGNGKVTTQTDALGNTHTFSYSSPDTTMTDPLSNTRKHTHSGNGEITTDQREGGKSCSMGYDSNGRRNTITDLLGDTTAYTYHTASGKLASVTNTDSTATTYAYTARIHSSGVIFDDLTGISYPDGTTPSFTYDSSGNMTSRTDRAGKVWSFTYNSNGQVLKGTNPSGGIITNTYNADATLATSTDASGNLTTYAYDSLKRLITITNADATTRIFTYDSNGNLLTVKDERNNTTTYTYDANNNIATLKDRLGNTTTFVYDDMDRVSSITDQLGKSSSKTYDEIGRLKTSKDKNDNTTTLGYDSRGRLTSITDGAGKVWAKTYDAESIIASATDPLSNATSFISDKMGRITKTTSPLSNVTNVTYDSMGRITTMKNPLNETTTNSYDSHGLISGISIPEGISASYTRNVFGLITTVTNPNSNMWNCTYDVQGRQASRTDPLGNATSYVYDNRNRISQATLPGSLGTQTIAYDGTNNVTRRLYSDGTGLNYTYDGEGKLTGADGVSLTYDANGRITSSNGITITRDSGGRIAAMALVAGKAVTYVFDTRNLLTSVTDWLGGTTTFAYDAAGQLASITRPNGITTTYTYDNDGRVTGLQEGSMSSISLTRDGNGQITAATRTLPLEPTLTSFTTTLTYDAASQVASYTYDAMGHLTNDGTRTYTWNLASRMAGYVEGSNTVTFAYDGLGNRLTRTEGGVTNSYAWNYAMGLPSVSIERSAGSDVRYYVHTPGGALLYSIEASGNTRKDYHYDEMGNTLFLTDSNGTVIASYAYNPYGKLLSSTGTESNSFTWQGQYGVMQEGTTGLYYMRARFYDSVSARFLNRDPIRTIGPKSVNPYQYAFANPLKNIDPSGLSVNPNVFPPPRPRAEIIPHPNNGSAGTTPGTGSGGSTPGTGSGGSTPSGNTGSDLSPAEELEKLVFEIKAAGQDEDVQDKLDRIDQIKAEHPKEYDRWDADFFSCCGGIGWMRLFKQTYLDPKGRAEEMKRRKELRERRKRKKQENKRESVRKYGPLKKWDPNLN